MAKPQSGEANFALKNTKSQPNIVVAILKGGARKRTQFSAISLWLLPETELSGLCADVELAM